MTTLRRHKAIILAAAIALVAAAAVLGVLFVGADEEPAATARPSGPALTPPPPSPTRAPDRSAENPGAEEARAAQLPFPSPRAFSVGTAKRSLAEFMSAWRVRSYERMETWSTRSWQLLQDEPVDALRQRLSARRIVGWRLVDVTGGPRFLEARIEIAYRFRLRPRLRRESFTVRLLRQTRGGALTGSGGRWGVDPRSVPATRAG